MLTQFLIVCTVLLAFLSAWLLCRWVVSAHRLYRIKKYQTKLMRLMK